MMFGAFYSAFDRLPVDSIFERLLTRDNISAKCQREKRQNERRERIDADKF